MKYSMVALALCAAGMSAQAADLTVSFAGMSAAKGQVMVALYASEEAWGKQEAVQVARLPAEGSLDTVFKNLPAGRYAIAAYLDGNLNGKLDRNAVGMPLEPYGFSRNASARYGRPVFADVAVALGKDDTKISIDLE